MQEHQKLSVAMHPNKISEKSVRYLKGIGPRKSELLERLGVRTVKDLCYFFPRRYEDRSHFQSIGELKIGGFATLRGKVISAQLKPLKKISLFELWIQDDSGVLPIIWFNKLSKLISIRTRPSTTGPPLVDGCINSGTIFSATALLMNFRPGTH